MSTYADYLSIRATLLTYIANVDPDSIYPRCTDPENSEAHFNPNGVFVCANEVSSHGAIGWYLIAPNQWEDVLTRLTLFAESFEESEIMARFSLGETREPYPDMRIPKPYRSRNEIIITAHKGEQSLFIPSARQVFRFNRRQQ